MNAGGGRVPRRSVTAEPYPAVARVCVGGDRSKARASKRSVTIKCSVDLPAGKHTTGRQTTGREGGREAGRQVRRVEGRERERGVQPASRTRSLCMR